MSEKFFKGVAWACGLSLLFWAVIFMEFCHAATVVDPKSHAKTVPLTIPIAAALNVEGLDNFLDRAQKAEYDVRSGYYRLRDNKSGHEYFVRRIW